MMSDFGKGTYYIQRSNMIGQLERLEDLQDYILDDDPYLNTLMSEAVYSRSKRKRLKATVRIVWYIRSISMMAGFRDRIRRYEREEK